MHPIYLTKALLPQLLGRESKSALVITSSGLGSTAVPGILTYSASKSFSSYLGEGLSIELAGKVDVLSFQCGETATKLLGKRKGFFVITPAQATSGCLRDLGSRSMTHGSFKHTLQMGLTPSWILQKAVNAAAP